MKRLLSSLLIGFIVVSCGPMKQHSDKERINAFCDQFMDRFVAYKTDEAIELLKMNTVMPASAIDSLKVTVSEQIKTVFPQFGEMLSYSFVREKRISDFIVERYYIIKLSRFFLKTKFTLYNSGSGWTVTAFAYSESIDELLK